MKKLFNDYNAGKLDSEDIETAISGAVSPDTGIMAEKGIAAVTASIKGPEKITAGLAKAALIKETEALKKAVNAMIDRGETDTAAKVLEQYKRVNPSDAEIADIAGRISEKVRGNKA